MDERTQIENIPPEEQTEASWRHGYLEGHRHGHKECADLITDLEARAAANPLLVVTRNVDDTVTTRIYPSGLSHEHFGLLICDLVRHAAGAFSVDEDDIWEWVDKERHSATTEIRRPS